MTLRERIDATKAADVAMDGLERLKLTDPGMYEELLQTADREGGLHYAWTFHDDATVEILLGGVSLARVPSWKVAPDPRRKLAFHA